MHKRYPGEAVDSVAAWIRAKDAEQKDEEVMA